MELKQYEEKVIFKHFENDQDHQYIHAIEVMNMANDINDTLELDIDKQLIFLAAISHDVEATKSYANHAEVAYNFVTENAELIKKEYRVDDHDVNLIAMACLQHRRDFAKNFHSGLAEIIHLADQLVNERYNEELLEAYKKGINEEVESQKDAILYVYDAVDFLIHRSQDRFQVIYEGYQKVPKSQKLTLLSKYLKFVLDKHPELKKQGLVLQMNAFR